ncbi:MAG: hypothetical protein RIC19_03705 [Phaeodactylibacter sp.]|uniref:hypothetical protein n=1 Tax=Phaeodactylibacter sp. TaxID=1940289 RepID=UPI0032EF8F46
MMKTLLLFVTILGLAATANPYASNHLQSEETLGGSITLENVVVLLTTTNDPSENILTIEVYDGAMVVMSFTGCGASVCRNNISLLANGTYSVVVTTDAGSFSGGITK